MIYEWCLMDLSEFYHHLPESLIAQHPAHPKDSSRLLVLNDDRTMQHKRFYDLISYLKKDDVLVLNSTKVLHAKLEGKKQSGSAAEIILTRCMNRKKLVYEARIRTRNPHLGMKILLDKAYATIISRKSIDEFIIRLSDKKALNNASLPNPPYIKHGVLDEEYQTVFARVSRDKGSLAAPTAGLHFTRKYLEDIKKKGVKIVFITLHVGFGTFLPIMDDIASHKTEEEYFEISNSAAKNINGRKGRLIVVGTTTLKALESSSKNRIIFPCRKSSGIFIYPGHEFSSGADALITNFHLPKSGLILLTCAFGGRERIMHAYDIAVKKRYRFYSLGDAMLIFKA